MPLTNRRELDSKRLRARLIDGVVIAIPAIVLLNADLDFGFALWLVIGAIQLSYFFMLEATVGQTLGKHLMGLKVSRPDGTPAGVAPVATRTLVRLIEEPLLGLLVMVLSGGRRQRIGDLLGGTVVTRASATWGLPSSSPLVVVYPVLWIGAAFGYGLFTADENRYLTQVAAICKARTDMQDRMQLDIVSVIKMSEVETQRIAALQPPDSMRDWHRDVLREKRQFDRLGKRAVRAVRTAHDPVGVATRFEGALLAEAEQHNTLFADAGLTDCAR